MKNMNDMAVAVTKAEGLKVQISIAQVKEVLRIVAGLMFRNPMAIAMLIKNGEKQKGKGK